RPGSGHARHKQHQSERKGFHDFLSRPAGDSTEKKCAEDRSRGARGRPYDRSIVTIYSTTRSVSPRWTRVVVLGLAIAAPAPAGAQSSLAGDPIRISPAPGRVIIDGDLGDEGWRGATRIDKWYETNPGDNVEPPVKNVGYLTYDDRFFYAA